MTDLVLGFLGGLVVALIAALIASISQRQNEEHKRRATAQFEIYMLLLELNADYFWIAGADLHGEPRPPGPMERTRKTAWRIADKIRECDHIALLDETLAVLFDSKYATANDRARALDSLIEKHGQLVNPRAAKTMRDISHDNVRAMADSSKATGNAPGFLR